jgi:hypothetical protein
MPTNINIHVEFSSPGGDLLFTDSVIDEREPNSTDQDKENLYRELFAELRKAVSFRDYLDALPKVNKLWESSSNRATKPLADPSALMDMFNVPAIWLEISNTFADIRFVLARAKAYKALEPPQTKPSTSPLCAYLHFEKTYKLNLAVFQLVKVQDLVVRLLQEAFSGKLIAVDYESEDWERDLLLADARAGLKTLANNGELTVADHQSIITALNYPSGSVHNKTVVDYRNRLAHGIRPSVDYIELHNDF